MTNSSDSRYGKFGGCYLPELLMPAILDLAKHFSEIQNDAKFQKEFYEILSTYVGRPSALTEVKNFRKHVNGPRVFLKREDLLHTGAHKINNAIGQCLLAKKMGKTRIIAETGAGQHGVATATACAYFNLECLVYMGEVDMQRQAPNVSRMRLLGAEICKVEYGAKTLKDAVNQALRDWATSFSDTHYCLGSALGPHPYPQMVAYFQAIIGKETKQQCIKQIGKNPDIIIACIGGGSNAIGIFAEFLSDESVKLIGVEAGGNGTKIGQHAARFLTGTPGVLHGCYSYVLQENGGQIADTHSISAGLDYPMIGPQHAHLHYTKRVHYTNASDIEAFNALKLLSKTEGIIPALESSHALAYYVKEASKMPKDACVIINLSGRGDKDLQQVFDFEEELKKAKGVKQHG
ncbi:MAG: tryptophan synthase subunit beta [Legionellales bacterium]|nr:MAG: tryptophan synthase subunit beta [Legionellales bacterium]